MDFTQLLGGPAGQQVIEEISNKSGATKEETSSVIQAATPVLIGMLHKNASSEQGASNLLNALKDHQGGILSNLSGALASEDTKKDGEGILNHILGNQQGQVQQMLSMNTGVSISKIMSILPLLAPVLLGLLGSKANSDKVSSGGGLSDLLGGIMGGMNNSSVGTNILGSILGGGKKDGLGGLMGNLFGKK